MAKSSKKSVNKLNISDFIYLDKIQNTSFPQLAIAIEIKPEFFDDEYCGYTKNFNFKADRKWYKIAHQSAGIACNQRYFITSFLNPKSLQVYKNMENLHKFYYGSSAGAFNISLDSILEYRKMLKDLFSVDCNYCWQNFEESVYPIDCTLDNIKKFTDEELPQDLDELIEWESGFQRAAGVINRWSFLILTENSD